MKIAFDAKRLFSNFTGLGNYSRTLVRNLQQRYPEHEYHLYADRLVKQEETSYFFDSSKFVLHEGPRYFKSIWRSKLLVQDLIRDKIDLYHGLSNELPYGIHKTSIKTVVTIHDLIFRAYPRQYKLLDRKIYHLKSKYAINNTNKTIAISLATKESIMQYYPVDDESISVLYQSFSDIYMGKSIDSKSDKSTLAKLRSFHDIPEKYFLYVGSIIQRKGLLMVAKAIKAMDIEHRRTVVVVGKGSHYLHTVKKYLEANQLESNFIFVGHISDTDLTLLYKQALALVFPSLMEGFGIPIVEAGSLKTPVISSNRSSLKEAGGPDIYQIDPTDYTDIASAMSKVLMGEYTTEQSNSVYQYIQKTFDGKKLSQDLMNIYMEL